MTRYAIPMPDDSRMSGVNTEKMALNGSVLSTVKSRRCPRRTDC